MLQRLPTLLRCPFCAGFADFRTLTSYATEWQAGCHNLACTVRPLAHQASTPELAAEHWNTRLVATSPNPSQGT